MALEHVPTDVVGDDLVRTYRNATRRLEGIVEAGLRRGLDPDRLGSPAQVRGDATQAYRARQLAAARAITSELERMAPQVAPVIARRAYASSLYAVDRVTLGRGAAALDNRFGGVHQRAVAALAANMSSSLEGAAARAGENVARVFARADALEAGIPPQGFPMVGRRINDPWRRVTLDTIAEGLVSLDTRRQVSATLYQNLLREGVTDATTGFVDRRGRRWGLDTYTEMVARTTTREATSRATVNRLTEVGLLLVTISSHPHHEDECSPYDGETFVLEGSDDRYPALDRLPPFHPRCRHVVTPAAVNLDDFERELGLAAEEGIDVEDLERVEPAPGINTPDNLPAGVDPPAGLVDRVDELLDAEGPAAAKKLESAADAIAQVHRVPGDLPPVPYKLRARPQGGGEAVYMRTRGGDAVGIEAKASAEDVINVHELGHYFDHKAFAHDGPGMASELVGGPMAAWREAIHATPTYRRLVEARDTGLLLHPTHGLVKLDARQRRLMDYLLRDRELFARSYEQWIGARAGLSSARHVDGIGVEFWAADEFAAIERELEDLFRRRGLLRERPRPTAPSTNRGTARRKEAQDRVDSWRLDPGETDDVAASRRAWQDATDEQAAKYERARKRADAKAVDEALGPDLVAILDDLAASGYKDARLPELRQALIDGDVTIEYVQELAEAELRRRYANKAARDQAAAERGLRRKPIPCFVCGRFKRRPSDICDHCGDEPGTYRGSAEDFNRAYGYGS